MIKLDQVSKKYDLSSNEYVLALDHISLTLPDRGLVFILGKSGSGKSTLLNLIGGLDTVSEGDIIVDGNYINKLNENALADYRNNYLGFIFQDYLLFDNLTVFENIKLSLSLQDNNDDALVDDLLEQVDLKEYRNRYPKNLSGGQKQRIVIARGIAKKPKILLCDEPTGNLDSQTATSILDLLKKISKDILVVVVSHNQDDAYKYADRIVEIADGHIIGDRVNESIQNDFVLDNGTLYVNNLHHLSSESLEEINNQLEKGQIQHLEPKSKLFVPKKDDEEEMKIEAFTQKKMPVNEKIKLSFRFQKKRLISTILVSLLCSLLAIILGLSETFVTFSAKEIMQNSLTSSDNAAFVMKKGRFDDENPEDIRDGSLVRINDDDIASFNNANGDEPYYFLSNFNLPISFDRFELSMEISISDRINLRYFYLGETYGTLLTNETFLDKVYPNYKVLAGDLYDKDYGIVITDYVADAILLYSKLNYSTYEDIIGPYKNKSQDSVGYINAIISTDYKNRYDDLISLFESYLSGGDVTYNDIVASDQYLDFYEEVRTFLGVDYALSPHFIEACQSYEARNYTRLDRTIFSLDGIDMNVIIPTYYAYSADEYSLDFPIEEKTIVFSLNEFNTLLNAHFTLEEINDFGIDTVHMQRIAAAYVEGEFIYDDYVKIVVKDTNDYRALLSPDLFITFRQIDTFNFAIYAENTASAMAIYEAMNQRAFYALSSYVSAAIAIKDVVNVFSDFFALVVIVLLISLISLLVLVALSNVRQMRHNIGVLKALGMKDNSISSLFIFQIIFMSIISIAGFIGGIFIFKEMTNDILFKSFMNFLRNPALKFIEILKLNPFVITSNILIILVVYGLSTLIPLLMMKRMKPLNIIRRSH